MTCDEPSQSMIFCSLADTRHFTPAGLVLVIALGLAACQQQTSRPRSLPTMVQIETVTLTDYAPPVRLTGEIRAQVESELALQRSGRITDTEGSSLCPSLSVQICQI
ncbi:efflux RND transporter periplasmic adaptor subunit [Microvirga massiliensis]|uniref:efflux RND transporter periplasmic adaptor subunit n=1 Tax=Microvirga massiliensis TaxID=1033741 RepID=UPI00062B60A5|nr:efflux RND transporter periplasmic adaptor subunit [Microvirga massiliensis]